MPTAPYVLTILLHLNSSVQPLLQFQEFTSREVCQERMAFLQKSINELSIAGSAAISCSPKYLKGK